MYAENLAKMSIPAVFESGCLAPSLMYLHTGNVQIIINYTVGVADLCDFKMYICRLYVFRRDIQTKMGSHTVCRDGPKYEGRRQP